MATTPLIPGFLVTVLLGYNLGESEACSCTREYVPVCGSNGVTYNNKCLLLCLGANHENRHGQFVEQISEGHCEDLTKKPKTQGRAFPGLRCPCPYNYDPVCGTDKVTYNNHCRLKCSGAALDFKGPCKGEE